MPRATNDDVHVARHLPDRFSQNAWRGRRFSMPPPVITENAIAVLGVGDDIVSYSEITRERMRKRGPRTAGGGVFDLAIETRPVWIDDHLSTPDSDNSEAPAGSSATRAAFLLERAERTERNAINPEWEERHAGRHFFPCSDRLPCEMRNCPFHRTLVGIRWLRHRRASPVISKFRALDPLAAAAF